MEELVWSLASLAVAGVALTVIVTPLAIGTRRAVRTVTRAIRRRAATGRNGQSNLHGTTLEAATVDRAAVAVAVPIPAAVIRHQERLRAQLRAETPQETVPMPGTPIPPFSMPERLVEEIRGKAKAEEALTPLERAVWQAHERRGVPRAVQAAWDEWCERGEGPHELVPGRYPLLGGLLSRQQIAQIAAAYGIDDWEQTAVTGAAPMDPTSDGWN